MVVKENTLVRLAIKLFDLQGNLLEETDKDGMLYLHGHEDIFPKIEEALEGKKVGDSVSLTLEAIDTFGDFDENAIYVVDIDDLANGQGVEPGLVFEEIPGVPKDGRRYRVTDVAQGKAVLDANHPYAGWTLRFEITVLGIEEAPEESIGTDDAVIPPFLSVIPKTPKQGGEF